MLNRSTPRSMVLASLAFGAGAASVALAQPAADLCAEAPVIGPGSYSGTTVGATRDGEAACAGSGSAPDVWYRITPPERAYLVLDLCGSGFDTVVSVHTGCPGEGAEVGCNDQSCGDQSRLTVLVQAGVTYLIRIGGWGTSAGAWTMGVSYVEPPPHVDGPDVVYQSVHDTWQSTPVGGMRSYGFGTVTCNIGSEPLIWQSTVSPGVAFNMYRLYGGRLEQIGQGWVKAACCAASGTGCGLPVCTPASFALGAGCSDLYSASYNSGQSRLRPRSESNPWTGQIGSSWGTAGSAVERRVQVRESDLAQGNYPGALYFAEGVYFASDERNPETKGNNASYRRVEASPGTFNLTFPAGAGTHVSVPAITAWREHGGGSGVPDESVEVQMVEVPGEGRFYVASKVAENGDGTWRYEYAVFNLNSHRSGRALSVPVAAGAAVSNVGFRDVDYHSGEPYDNTDWSWNIGGGAVTWSSPQTYAQNPNTNALRWGTMYNFWFDADRPPAEGEATLELFRPGTPGSVAVALRVPVDAGGGCAADWNGDGSVNSGDITAFLTDWIASVQDGTLAGDFNGDGAVNSGDITAMLTAWLEAVQQGGC